MSGRFDYRCKYTWNMSILGNVKHLIWKARNDILPAKFNLHKRGVTEDMLCPICDHNLSHSIEFSLHCGYLGRKEWGTLEMAKCYRGFYGDFGETAGQENK